MNSLEYERRLMALKLPSLDYRRAYLQLYMVTMIMRLFVPYSSCMYLLELEPVEGTLSHYIKRLLTNPYKTKLYKQLEQPAIQHHINTKLPQKLSI